MTCAFIPPTHGAVDSMFLDAARAWRHARDNRQSVQPALYRVLDTCHCGILAPVIDSVLGLYEACSGRRFRVRDGSSARNGLSVDEHRLLNLLHESNSCDAALLDVSRNPGLASAMRVALRSTRIMLRLTFGPAAPSQHRGAMAPARVATNDSATLGCCVG